MKKILLLTIVSFSLAHFAQAQMAKGSVLAGIDVSANYSKNGTEPNETKQTSFYANPSVGVAVKQNTVFGARLLYGHGKYTYTSSPKQESNQFGGGVFLRRYVLLAKKVYLFGEAGADYNHQKTEQNSSTYGYKTKGNGAALTVYPGLSYAVGKKLLLEAGLNKLLAISYTHSETENTDILGNVSTSKSTAFGISSVIGANTSFSLGFRLLFGNQ